ncbi:MAG: hypothetical protein LV471_09110 [Nitrosomonas sp.]|nr:hypothetical protein [Nitrosomonas sp.]
MRSKGKQVQEIYKDDEFESLLDDAEKNAANYWEETFVSDLKSKFEQFGRSMYLSESQQDHLEGIAGDDKS